jgi:hypothetical protein
MHFPFKNQPTATLQNKIQLMSKGVVATMTLRAIIAPKTIWKSDNYLLKILQLVTL